MTRPPELVDTHCHLNFERYDEDRSAVLRRAAVAGVRRIIVPAIDRASCHEALALARDCGGIYVAVGIHPNSSAAFTASDIGALTELAADDKVVAIGEIGLDYYWDKCPPQVQRSAFQAQLDLAAQLQLPVIIHNREADADVLALLEAWAPAAPADLQGRLGVLHSFSASRQLAERALALGFYLGFTGPITFKKADALRAVAAATPLDRILIETDGPFLAPHPNRGRRNEPAYLRYVNEKLAELHNISAADMAAHTTRNAQRLFGWPPCC